MTTGVGSVSVDLKANTGTFETDFARAARLAKTHSESIGASTIAIGVALGGFITQAVESIARAVENVIATGAQIERMSQKTGLSTQALSALRVAAVETGQDFDRLGKVVTKVAGIQFDAASGSKKAQAEMRAFGITAKDTADTALDKLLRGFGALPANFDRAGLAVKLFGQRLGTDFLLIADQTQDGLKGLEAHTDSLGLLMDGPAAKAAEDFEKNLADIKLIVEGLAEKVFEALAPSLVSATDEMKKFGEQKAAAQEIADVLQAVATVAGKVYDVIKYITNQMVVLGGTALLIYDKVTGGNTKSDWAAMHGGAEGSRDALRALVGNAPPPVITHAPVTITETGQTPDSMLRLTDQQVEAQKKQEALIKQLNVDLGEHTKKQKDDTAAIRAATDAAIAFHDKVSEVQGRNQSPYEQAAATAQKEYDQLKKTAEAANALAVGKHKLAGENGALKITTQDLTVAQKAFNDRLAETAANFKAADLGPVTEEAHNYAEALRILRLNERDLGYTAKETALAEALLAREHELAAKAAKDQLDPGAAILRDLTDQLNLLHMNNVEQATFNQLKNLSIDDQKKWHGAVLAANQALEDQNRIIQVQDSLRGDVQSFFTDIMDGSKSAKQAFKDLVNSIVADISRMVSQMITARLFGQQGQSGGGSMGGGIFGLLGNLFGGGSNGSFAANGLPGSAKGNIFDSGNIVPFARGGVVSQPTMFPMANGMGIMGEGGNPEGVLPLKRDRSGNLGVIVANGGGGVVQNIYVQGTVNQRTAQQIQQEAAVKQRRAVGRNA
jgi:hypothetical protein